jgi:hypothetical protein
MDIVINIPTKEESCYRFNIHVGGKTYTGYLSYELYPNLKSDRTLIITKIPPDDILDLSKKSEFSYFRDIIGWRKGRKFEGTKYLVNQIEEKHLKIPNVRITVHKYGAVPVYVLPKEYPVTLHNQEIKVQIALYPILPASPTHGNYPEFITSRYEFIRSLSLGTSVIFQRYLEDVAEDFFDIEHNLSMRQVFERSKQAETTLAESIASKLEALIPNQQALQMFHKGKLLDESQQLTCELFEGNLDTIFNASYCRIYALYLINELYRHIGISSRSSKYSYAFKQLQREFDTLTFDGWYCESIKDRLSHIKILNNTLRAYDSGDVDEIERIRNSIQLAENEPLWLVHFIGFALFVAFLEKSSKEFNLSPYQGRIFISSLHDTPSNETLISQIKDLLKKEAGESIKTVFFKSSPGPIIRSSIKRLIWLSDLVHAIIPADPTTISSDSKNYIWIGIEAEHGLLLDKRLIYFIEEGTDIERVKRDFSSVAEELLSKTPRIRVEHRIEGLIKSLDDRVFEKYKVHTTDISSEYLDERIKKIIQGEIKKTIIDRHVEAISGLFSQFPNDKPYFIRSTLGRIQKLVPYPNNNNKKWLASQLVKEYPTVYHTEQRALKAITNAWNDSKKRSLYINGKNEFLINLMKKRYYTGKLRSIIKILNPKILESDIYEIENKILDRL